jgi:hypothetical protein
MSAPVFQGRPWESANAMNAAKIASVGGVTGATTDGDSKSAVSFTPGSWRSLGVLSLSAFSTTARIHAGFCGALLVPSTSLNALAMALATTKPVVR